MTPTETVSPLSEVVTPKTYQAERTHIFPGPSSIEWFIRTHKAELVASGALIKVAKSWAIVPSKADAIVIAIGERLAKKAVA